MKCVLNDVETAVEIVVADSHAHAGLSLPSSLSATPRSNAFFAKRAVVIVHQQQAGSGIAGDENIRPAIIVGVGGARPSVRKMPRTARDTGFLRNIGERAVAVVAIERVRGRAAGRGVRSSPERLRSCSWHVQRRLGQRLRDRSRHSSKQTDRGGRRGRNRQTCSRSPNALSRPAGPPACHIGERAVAVVAIENVLSVVGEEQIFEAIVVVVADANAERPADVR